MPRTGAQGRSRRKVKTNTKPPSSKPLDETLIEDSSDPDDCTDKEYSVEAVLCRRGYGSEREYNVKWRGYPSSQNTWYVLSHSLSFSLPLSPPHSVHSVPCVFPRGFVSGPCFAMSSLFDVCLLPPVCLDCTQGTDLQFDCLPATG